MKRRAPIIWALLVTVGVTALWYHEKKVRSENARAAAAKEQEEKTEAAKTSNSVEDKKSQDGQNPLQTAPAAPVLPSTGRFHTLPDGSPIPALPSSAPKKVKLGVVLFRYEGAQGTSDSTRSREAALNLAKKAVELAQKDFAAAVKTGDRGSSENIGWMKQRILERSVEHAVFNLEKGKISQEPVDTPRGFWVVKRLR